VQKVFLADTPILAYHQITKDDLPKDPSGFAVSVSQFERQMRYLHDHRHRCLSLMELLPPSGNKPHRQGKTFVLTFDDGYEDFLTQAYPILRRYGFTATVFLVTDHVREQSDWEGQRGTPLLTWEHVDALHEDGISFGSHTCTHPWLTRLSNEQIWHELVASKERLEAKLGQEIPLLAYPYGDSNSEIQRMAMAAGYKAACGVDRGRSGRFNLWRYPCRTNDSLPTFILKLTHWYRYPGWFREETVVGQFLREIKRRWFPDRRKLSK
jgi:peptidoglycan/xylan/chitin deacetylase (PgdA/CDA1 family)